MFDEAKCIISEMDGVSGVSVEVNLFVWAFLGHFFLSYLLQERGREKKERIEIKGVTDYSC